MKATVDSGAFFKALNRIIPLLKVSAIPALSEASIWFHDGICTITATDLELWVQADIPAEGTTSVLSSPAQSPSRRQGSSSVAR